MGQGGCEAAGLGTICEGALLPAFVHSARLSAMHLYPTSIESIHLPTAASWKQDAVIKRLLALSCM
jgi:hypothetical protein